MAKRTTSKPHGHTVVTLRGHSDALKHLSSRLLESRSILHEFMAATGVEEMSWTVGHFRYSLRLERLSQPAAFPSPPTPPALPTAPGASGQGKGVAFHSPSTLALSIDRMMDSRALVEITDVLDAVTREAKVDLDRIAALIGVTRGDLLKDGWSVMVRAVHAGVHPQLGDGRRAVCTLVRAVLDQIPGSSRLRQLLLQLEGP